LAKYEIDHSCLRDWLKKYDYNWKKVVLLLSKERVNDMAKYKDLPLDRAEAQRAYKELQEQLEMARLEAAGYREMVKTAEEEFGLPIRKKLGAKQS